jgi:ADP-heptose:LPS heptosyltransferase
LKKVLIIRLSSIGDIVLTTPVIRCLKQQLPDCELHFAVKEAFLPVIKANPSIDTIHVFKGNLREMVLSLRNENFDHIVDLHKNQRTFLIKSFLHLSTFPPFHPSTSTFSKLNLRKWLLVNFKWNLLPDIHIVDRYFVAVKNLGIKNDGKGLDYFIPEDEEVDISQLPASFHNGFVAFVIGAKHFTKALPVQKVIDLIGSSSRPVILLGGPEDHDKGESIVATLASDHVFNACGQYTINQSASLIRQADKVITHDTGLMHISAAFQKDIISIWGNTVPEFGMYPYLPGKPGKSEILEVKGLSCRPCSKIGFDKCPKGHFRCMEDLESFKF